MKKYSLSWAGFAVGAAAWLSLSIAALASELLSESEGDHGPQKDVTLGILLLFLAALWLATAFVARDLDPPAVVILWPDFGGLLLLSGGLALTIELAVRLAAASQFGGRATAFDFGLKCASGEAAACLERNVAFTPEFNSFGHCIQGFFSLLLFPSVFFVNRSAKLVLEGGSCVLAVYPIYNIIKRAVNQSSGFAASSFANNGAEWSMGFVLGLTVRMLCSSARRRWRPGPQEEQDPPDRWQSPAGRGVWLLRVMAGGVLCAVSLTAAALFGLSWDNTAAAESEDATDVAALVAMLAIAFLCVFCAVAAQYRLQQKEGDDEVTTARPERSSPEAAPAGGQV